MKQLSKWIIPVGILLLIGVLVGFFWNEFPANEQVSIPVVKKKPELKVVPDVNSSVQNDSINRGLTSNDRMLLQQDSIKAEIASIENNTSKFTDEVLTPDETILPNDEPIEVATKQNKNIQPKENPVVSDVAISKQPVRTTPKNNREQTASNTKVYSPQAGSSSERNSTPAETTSKRKSIPEQPQKDANRNVTPSLVNTAKSKNRIPAETGKAPKPQIFASSSQKQLPEPESYMSTRQIPVDYLVEVDGTYKPAASGKGVSAATFIVYNRSGKNLKKVNMEVQYLSKENQLLKKLVLPVSNISADGAVTLNAPANGEADRLVYKVLYVSSAVGDFYYEPLVTYASASR